MITKQDKKDFDFCVKAHIVFLKEMNKGYYHNLELFKVLIDINLECIETLEILSE